MKTLRRKRALDRLESQLVFGVKTAKNSHFKKTGEHTLSLTAADIKRIEQEIETLQRRITYVS